MKMITLNGDFYVNYHDLCEFLYKGVNKKTTTEIYYEVTNLETKYWNSIDDCPLCGEKVEVWN